MSSANLTNPISTQHLINLLIQLNGLKPAQVADAAHIRRPNLYTWFKGKSKILSSSMIDNLFETLGVANNRLLGSIIHCWQVGEALDDFQQVLEAIVDKKSLAQSEIYFIDCGKKQYFNLLRIPSGAHEAITLLIRHQKSKGNGYPLNAARLGFGNDKGITDIPLSVCEAWWNEQRLTATSFWIAAKPYFTNLDSIASPEVTPENLIDLRTEYERQIAELSADVKEKTAENAGLRGVIRGLIQALRKVDPKNALLTHETRDWQYESYYLEELEKLTQQPIKEKC